MFGNKALFVIGALLAISCGLAASAAVCKGCSGKQLAKSLDALDGRRKCWLSMDNHVLLSFKLAVLNGVAGVLEDLYKKSNELSRSECKTDVIPDCAPSGDTDDDIECVIDHMKKMANAYVELEECNGELLDPEDLNMMFRVMAGSTAGWRVVHPTC